MNQITLGQFIAQSRKEKGLTQRELAEMLNVSDKTISHWERDESSPDISLLITISEIFGITVDELLKREKNPPSDDSFISPQSENSMKETEKAKISKPKDTAEDRFGKYRLLSLIGTAFGLFALVSVVFSGTVLMDVFGRYTALDVARTFPIISAIKPLVISLVATLGARIYFSHTFIPNEENDESIYIYKANRIFVINLYIVLATVIFGVAPVFNFVPYITLYVLTFLITAVSIIAADSLLKSKGVLKPKNEKLFRLRIITVLVTTALIVAGGGFWGFAELWSPSAKEIVFDSADEFVSFVETPVTEHKDAWKVTGVPVSTFPSDSGIYDSASEEYAEENIHTVYDFQNAKTISFRLLNGNVYKYYASLEDRKYHVLTFDEKLKTTNWGSVQDTVSIVIPVYCVGVILLSFLIYMKKAEKLR